MLLNFVYNLAHISYLNHPEKGKKNELLNDGKPCMISTNNRAKKKLIITIITIIIAVIIIKADFITTLKETQLL